MASPTWAAPELQSDTTVATAGYYRLSWRSGTEGEFVLEEATDAAFSQPKTLYRGADTATLLSGRADGVYYYRVRDAGNVWSNTMTVEVVHHPLSKALMFFVLGAIVFAATLVAVLYGGKTRN